MHRSLIVICIISMCHMNNVSSTIRTTMLNYTIPSDKFNSLFQDYRQLVSSSQAYGGCKIEALRTRFNSTCRFILETRQSIESPDHFRSCDFDVAFPEDSTRTFDVADSELAAITEDKAVLVLKGTCDHNLYVLHFSDCTAVPVKYKNNTSIRDCIHGFTVTAPHDNQFDVLWEESDNRIWRRLTADVDGNVIADVPELFPGLMMHRENGFLYSPMKGRLLACVLEDENGEKWTMNICTFDENGMKHALKEYPVPIGSAMMVSTTDELLSACAETNIDSTTFTCVQFNSNGEVEFELSTLRLTEERTLQGVYNLPGGGFNLITAKCLVMRRQTDDFCPFDKIERTVTKFDRKGKIVGSLKMPTFNSDWKDGPDFHFFKAETGESCFSKQYSRDISGQISFWIICFDDNDYVEKSSALNVIE